MKSIAKEVYSKTIHSDLTPNIRISDKVLYMYNAMIKYVNGKCQYD